MEKPARGSRRESRRQSWPWSRQALQVPVTRLLVLIRRRWRLWRGRKTARGPKRTGRLTSRWVYLAEYCLSGSSHDEYQGS